MKKLLVFLLAFLAINVSAQKKREFRGAWIQCVNGQFQGMGTQKMQQTLTYQLDELQKDGVNAIIFQVRPECDALYQSSIEPWSRFLTGQQGKAPSPYWDPLQWMIEQCHQRGMELHAWINPYRAKTKGTTALATTHVAIQHPERCFDYDGLKILNPGIPENRDYICEVAKDIVAVFIWMTISILILQQDRLFLMMHSIVFIVMASRIVATGAGIMWTCLSSSSMRRYMP